MNTKVEEKVKEIIKKVEERAFESGRSDVAHSDLIRALVEEILDLEERQSATVNFLLKALQHACQPCSDG